LLGDSIIAQSSKRHKPFAKGISKIFAFDFNEKILNWQKI
jgi:hypothetical protein